MTESTDNPQWTFKRAPLGAGGGFVIGIDFAGDGSRKICCTDVWNGYIRDEGDSEWRLMLRPDTLPRDQYWSEERERYQLKQMREKAGQELGMYAARIAPSDPNRIYAAWNAQVFRSDDGGKSFTRTNLPWHTMRSNGPHNRRFNRGIDVHPTDPDRVLVGTQADGCHYSLDGGENWATIDLPQTETDESGPGKYLVAFSIRHPENVYVHVFGTGLYQSVRGPAGPFLFAGGPKKVSCLVPSPDGSVYVCAYRSGNKRVNRFQDGEWRAIDNSINADQVAVDPSDPNHLVWADEFGHGMGETTNLGQSVRWMPRLYRGEGESEWLSNDWKRVYVAQLLFDPLVKNRLWIAEGVGTGYIDLADRHQGRDAMHPVMHDTNTGISEFVATCGLSTAGNPVNLIGVMDKGVWRIDGDENDGWAYAPSPNREANSSAVAHIRAIDDAIDDPDFVVGVFDQDGGPGYSTDRGKSFQPFAATPPGSGNWRPGGDCAVSTRDNFIIVQANNGSAVWTKDGGKSFQTVDLQEGRTPWRWILTYYVIRDCMWADPDRPGTFFCVVNNMERGNKVGRDIAGLWKNSNGGEGPWEHVIEGVIHDPNDRNHTLAQFWQAKGACIPGRVGEMLWANCEGVVRDKLAWIKEDGKVVEALPMSGVRAWSFGKNYEGRDYPALYVFGTHKRQEGLWATFDWFATDPIFITRHPGGNLDTVCGGGGLLGDMNVLGRHYVGFQGSGWLQGDLVA